MTALAGTRGFSQAAVATRRATLGAECAIDHRALVGPHHDGAAALGERVRPHRRAGDHRGPDRPLAGSLAPKITSPPVGLAWEKSGESHSKTPRATNPAGMRGR